MGTRGTDQSELKAALRADGTHPECELLREGEADVTGVEMIGNQIGPIAIKQLQAPHRKPPTPQGTFLDPQADVAAIQHLPAVLPQGRRSNRCQAPVDRKIHPFREAQIGQVAIDRNRSDAVDCHDWPGLHISQPTDRCSEPPSSAVSIVSRLDQAT